MTGFQLELVNVRRGKEQIADARRGCDECGDVDARLPAESGDRDAFQTEQEVERLGLHHGDGRDAKGS